jgi:hypothetical protein
MIGPKMENRASINFVLNHPYSWNPKKKLEFIEATANYLASRTSDAKSDREKLKKMLSSDLKRDEVNHEVGWKGNLCKKVIRYTLKGILKIPTRQEKPQKITMLWTI